MCSCFRGSQGHVPGPSGVISPLLPEILAGCSSLRPRHVRVVAGPHAVLCAPSASLCRLWYGIMWRALLLCRAPQEPCRVRTVISSFELPCAFRWFLLVWKRSTNIQLPLSISSPGLFGCLVCFYMPVDFYGLPSFVDVLMSGVGHSGAGSPCRPSTANVAAASLLHPCSLHVGTSRRPA